MNGLVEAHFLMECASTSPFFILQNGKFQFIGQLNRLPLMRELAIADFRQLTEGEKKSSPPVKNQFNN